MTIQVHRTRRQILAMAGATIAAGCVPSLPGSGSAPQQFRLTAKTTFPADLQPADWALTIAEPTAERALDTNRVARLQDGLQVDYVANAVWSDRAPTMVQNLIVQSFRASGAVASVGTNRDRIRANFMLRSTLRGFYFVQAAEDLLARIGLDVDLLTMPRREIVAKESFTEEVDAGDGGLDALVRAFDDALGRTLKSLVLWTVDAGNENFDKAS